jgi:hypothetical protein
MTCDRSVVSHGISVQKSIQFYTEGTSPLQESGIRLDFRFGLWFLMPLSTIYQLYRDGQFYWWRKPKYRSLTFGVRGKSYGV